MVRGCCALRGSALGEDWHPSVKVLKLPEAAVSRYAYVLATAFVLTCCAAGAVLGVVVVLVRCGVESIGGWRG